MSIEQQKQVIIDTFRFKNNSTLVDRFMNLKAFKVKPEYGEGFNHPDYRRGESPAGMVHTSARALAKLGAYMANRGTF